MVPILVQVENKNSEVRCARRDGTGAPGSSGPGAGMCGAPGSSTCFTWIPSIRKQTHGAGGTAGPITGTITRYRARPTAGQAIGSRAACEGVAWHEDEVPTNRRRGIQFLEPRFRSHEVLRMVPRGAVLCFCPPACRSKDSQGHVMAQPSYVLLVAHRGQGDVKDGPMRRHAIGRYLGHKSKSWGRQLAYSYYLGCRHGTIGVPGRDQEMAYSWRGRSKTSSLGKQVVERMVRR